MSNDLRIAAQQALEALEALQGGCTDHDDGTVEAITVWCPEVIDALRAALAQPVQGEPVAATEDELRQLFEKLQTRYRLSFIGSEPLGESPDE